MSECLDFTKSPAKEALLDWWRNLDENKGDRAEMRRLTDFSHMAFIPAFHHLVFSIQKLEPKFLSRDKLALMAALASHVRENVPGNIAEQMASDRGRSAPIVSKFRFRRLLEIEIRPDHKLEDRNELFRHFQRIIKILRGTISLSNLAQTVYSWGDKNEKTKKGLAYAYYAKTVSKKSD